MATIHECDVCGRKCSRIHHGEAHGMDCSACDECAGYEPEAYDEEADPLLMSPYARVAWMRAKLGDMDFPSGPSIGDCVTTPTGLSFTWDGEKWRDE